MTNNNTFFDKEPAAIATIVSRKDNLSYEILLISYVEDDEEKHQRLLFYFYNACHMTKSDSNKIGVLTNKEVMSIYSGNKSCGEIAVSDNKGNPLYKMILVSHAKNESAIEKHQERFGMASYITSSFSVIYNEEVNTTIDNEKNDFRKEI